MTRDPGDRLRYLLTLSRPRFWLYLAGPVLVGAVYGASSLEDLASPLFLVLALYFSLPANVFLYGVNDRFDLELDRKNPRKERRESRWRGDPVVTAAVAAAGLLGLLTLWVSPAVSWPYLAGFFVLAVAYSAPPVRLKTTPPLDSLSNGLYVLPGAAAFVALSGTHPPLFALLGAWLWTMAMHTFSAIPDIQPDRRAGVRTTATVLGERRALAYCALVWTAALVAFGALDARLGVLFGVYPLLSFLIGQSAVTVDRAYWWFPALNATVGAVLTIGGLIELAPPEVALP